MCRDCGCGLLDAADHTHAEEHAHDHDHGHHRHRDEAHDHDPVTRTIEVRKRILAHNDDLARRLRAEFARHGVLAVNLVSGPGAGKTELLARTLTERADTWVMAAVTGDLATENDASRLAASGARAKQILTGTMCHLETDMVADAIAEWNLDDLDLLFVENVGNLVCPSDFDLGEGLRVLLVSTTEGEDKPRKYPTLTISADVALINKTDLADAVECDVDLLEANLREVNPGMEVLRVSARTGEGLDAWYELLQRRLAALLASA